MKSGIDENKLVLSEWCTLCGENLAIIVDETIIGSSK